MAAMAAALTLVVRGAGDPRWLVVRRPEPPHEWSLPGGHVERGESPIRAAARELREETGVTATSEIPLCHMRWGGSDVTVFVIPTWRGNPRAAEGLPVTWLTWRQLRGQAVRFGPSLDRIESAFRARYGAAP